MAKGRKFETFTADDILEVWLDALESSLGRGQKLAAEITDPKGATVRGFRTTINARLKVAPFNAADFRKTTRVAKDLGGICAIMAATAKNKVVTIDVFQRARQLTKLHPTCPDPTAKGTGPFC